MTHIKTEGRAVVRIAAREPHEDVRSALSDGDRAVHAVGSTGVTGIEPLVMVTHEGRTGFVPSCSSDTAASVAAALEDGFEAAVSEAAAVTDHDPDAGRLPTAAIDGLSVGDRRVLGPCGWLRPTEADDYDAAVGFALPDRADIEGAGEAVEGRGWGDWCRDAPLAPAWTTAREAAGEPIVVVNAHGSAADTLLLSSAPFAVLHGAMATARAVGADRVVVYPLTQLSAAIRAMRASLAAIAEGRVADNILDFGELTEAVGFGRYHETADRYRD